ncbi:uncharacterized protein C2orf16 homolog [Suncus etruscus]|uniref:uncharacterized protein C2orf16 homolog n=1 Tax=Suncus etruscus TaxID=109475 RepID=UPI0021108AAC|nr:uncharacterized protein C2orf16 homolog [Suncus etruscus]
MPKGLKAASLWVLFSKKSEKQVVTTVDTETSRQHKPRKVQEFTGQKSQEWENFKMGCTEASLACISELPVGWTQQYIFWSMNRSLRHIFQYLENARSSLLELYLSKHQDMLSSTSSIIVAQEAILPCCVCKKAKHTDLDISSGSSRDTSGLSQLPVFSEGTTWKLQSQSLTTLQRKQNSRVRNQLSSLYSFNFPEIRNSKALQKLEILPLIRTQGTFIKSSTEHSEICKQKKKAKIKRKIKRYVIADRPYSTFKKTPIAPASTRISPLSRWELEGHMAWKVCSLREQRVPLPVRDSWIAMNYIIEAQEGIPKPEKTQIHSSRSKYQNYEKNVKKKSPDLASVLIQVNTKVKSELNKTETKISQSLIPGKQSPKGDTQILGYRPSVKSMNTAPAKSLVADQNQEATTFLQKDPKHLLELKLKQRVTGFPEKTQHHKTQATKVELTPKLPYQFTDNVKVTPQELHQVMDSMGMIPESHSEEIGSTDLFPQSPNEAGKPVETIKTDIIRHKLFQNTKSVDVTPEPKYHSIDSDRPSKPVTHTDNLRVTPVELLQVMDTMGMIKKPHPNIESMTVIPRPQYKVTEAVKMNIQFNDQIKQPEKKSPRLQHLITKKVEMSPRLQNKIIESVDLTSRPQNKAMKSNITVPAPFYQNKESPAMISRSLPQVMKITPVALLQTMDFMGIIPPSPPRVIESGGMIPISQLKSRENLNLSVPPVFPDIKTTELTKKPPQGDTKLKLVESAPKSSLQDSTMSTDVKRPQMTGHRGLILETQKQGKTYEELVPGTNAQTIKSVELKSNATEPEGLAPGHQASESSGMFSESKYQDIKPKFTFDTCHETKESVGLIQSPLRDIPGPLNQVSEFVSMNSESSQNIPDMMLQSMNVMGDTPVSQYTTQTSLKLVPISEMQGAKSEVLIPELPEKESLKLEMQHENSVPTAQDLKFRKLTYEASPLVAGTTQFITGPQPNVMELTQGPQLQAVKTRQLDPELQLQDVKFVDLIRQSDSRVVDSETMIQKPTLQNKTLEELTKEAQHQGMKLTRGPSLQSVKFSVLSPNLFLQEEKPADLISGSPYQNAQSNELTLGYPMQEIKLSDQEYQTVTSARLSSEPHQDKNFVELTSGPCLQNVRFSDLTPEPKHKEIIDAHSIGEKPFQVTGSITFITKPSLQPNQRTPVGGIKSSRSFEGPPSHSTKSIKLISQQQGMKPEEVYLIPRQEDVKFSKLTSGPKLQGVKFREGTPEPVFHDVNSVDVTTELGVQDSKLVMIPAGLQVNKQVGFNTRPWLQDVKFCDQTSGTQPQVIKSSTFNLTQLQCVRLPELTSEPKGQGIRSMKLTSGPEQQGARPDMLVSEPLFQGIKYTENQISSFQNNTSYKLASESSVPDVKSMDFTPAPKLPNVNHCELTRRSQLQGFESSELSQRPQMQDIKPMKWMSVSKPQGLKPDLTTESQNGRIKDKNLSPVQQFQEKALVNLTPEPEKELSAVSPVQQHVLSEQLKKCSKSLKDNVCLGLIQDPTFKGRDVVSHNLQLQLKGKKSLEPAPELNMECVQLKEVKLEPQLQSIKPPKLTQGPQLLQVKPISQPPFQGRVTLETEKEPPLENMKCAQWILQPEFQGGDSVALNLGSQSQDVKSVESKPLIWLRDMKSPKLTLESKIQDTTCMGPQFQKVKTPKLFPRQQLQERKLLVSSSEPPLKGVKTVDLSTKLKLGSMNSSKWIPLAEFQDIISQLNIEPQSQCIKPTELKHLIQLRNIKSSVLTPRPKLQDTQSSASFQEKPGVKLKSTQSCDLRSKSKPHDIKSIMLQPKIPLHDRKSLESTMKPQLQEVKPLQFHPGIQFQAVKTPKSLPIKSMNSAKKNIQKNFASVKSEVSSEPQWEGLQYSKFPLETKCQDKKFTELEPSSHMQGIPFSQVATGIKNSVVKSTDFNVGLLLQNAASGKLKSMPQWQGEESGMTMGSELQKVKSVDCKSSPQLQDMSFPRLITGLKVHNIKSLKCTVDPQVKVVKSSEVIPVENLRGVKSIELDPHPKLQDEKSSEFALGRKFSGVKYVESQLAPQLKNRNCSDLIMDIKLKNIESVGFSSILQFQGMKSSAVVPGTKIQAEKSMFNSGAQTQSKKNSQLIKLQRKNSTKVNHEPEFQVGKSTKLSLGPRIHSVMCSESRAEKQGQVKESSKMSPWPELQGVKFMAFNRELQLQHIKSSELCKKTIHQDVKSIKLNHEQKFQNEEYSELLLKPKFQEERFSVLNPGLSTENDLHTQTKCPVKQFREHKHESKFQGSHLQGANSSILIPESRPQCVNSTECHPRPNMQDLNASETETPVSKLQRFRENPGTETESQTSMKFNTEPHLQDLKPEFIPNSTFLHVTTNGYNLEPQMQYVNFSKLSPGPKVHCANDIGCKYGPPLQSIKFSELASGTKCKDMTSSDLKPKLEYQGIKSTINRESLMQDMKSYDLNPGPEFQGTTSILFNSKPHLQEPGSQDMKSLKSNLWSQPQSSLGFTSCLTPKCVNSDNSVLQPCFQDVKSVQLMPAVQQQGINCQEITSGQQGVKSSVVLAQEPSKKFIPGPILTSVKISNLSLESQQQDMTSLELTSHPKLHDIKCMKFPLVLQQKTPTGPLLQRVNSENLVPRMNNKMTDFSEVSSRSGHQSVENAEMTPKSSHQISQSVNLLLPTYQLAESSKMPHNLAHQSARTVKKSVGLTPKPMESSGMPLDRDFNGPESADLTSSLRTHGSHFSELAPEKSYQISESLSISQSGSKIKELGEFHIRQLRQDVAPEEIIPELKHHVTETMKLISEVRSQREEFSGIMPETKSVSKATGYGNKSSNSYPQTLEPVEIIPEKRSCGQEYVALITSDHFTEPLEMTVDEFVELISERGLQAEGSIKLTGIPQQKVEYAKLEHQVQESEHLTSKQCSQRKESLQLPLKETGHCEKHVNFVKKTSDTWQKGERSTWQTQIDKKSVNYSEIVPEKLGQKSLDQIRQKTQLQAAQTKGVTSVVTSKLESVTGNPGLPIQVEKSVTLPPWTSSQMVDYTETTPQQQDRRLSELISGLWFQNKKANKFITEPTHQIVEIIDMTGFQIVKTILFPGPPFQIIKSEKLAPGPIPQVLEPIGISLVLGRNNMNYFDLLTMTNFQEWAEPVELSARSNNEIKSSEFSSKAASPFMGLTELTHEEKLLALKSLSEKTVPFQVTESEDFILKQLCLNRGSEELTSGVELQKEKYFPKFPCNSSNSLISSTIKTSSGLGCFWDMEMPEVLKTMETKNSATHFLQSEEFFDQSKRPLSTQPPLNIVNTVKKTHSEVLGKDIVFKERTMLGQVEEPKKSSQSLSQYFPQHSRSSSKTFQKRPGARGSLPCFVLRRQQNVWESHSWKQRLPRKYLSSMLVLGNVLQTNMERKLCSQTDLSEGANTHQSIQNVFGVPPELIEFSQSLPKKGWSAISPPAVGKNYIQRHTLHYGNNDKRVTLRMWTRRSMSSMMQQYSAARIKIKKISPKLNDKVQELIHCMPISYNTESQLPFPGKSPLNKYLAESPFPVEESENSYTHTDFQHSYKPSYASQAKTIFSEQFQLLQELQLKIAAKLLRSQVPHNVPPPLSSGLVLKYPICLKCGQCAGFDCCHQAQTSSGPYLLIYPQLHLVSTPEGHGEIRLHLGFRLRTGKRPQIPKYHRRDRPVTPKSFQSLSQRKPKIHTQVSTSTLDSESGSTQSPLQYHIRQRLCNSRDLVGKRKAGKSSHCEVTQVHSLPDTDSESNEDEKWANVRRKKPNYLKNRTTKGVRTPTTKFYTNGRNTTQSQLRELPMQPEGKNNGTSQMMTISLEKQPKKSCQPKFIQILSQSIKQAFQRAHNIIAFAAHKFEERTRSGYVCEDKDNHPEQKDISSSKDRMSVVNLNPIGTITKQKIPSGDTTDQFISSQQPKTVQSFQSKVTHLLKPKVSQESSTYYSRKKDSNTRVKENYRSETSSNESRKSKVGNTNHPSDSKRSHPCPSERSCRISSERRFCMASGRKWRVLGRIPRVRWEAWSLRE